MKWRFKGHPRCARRPCATAASASRRPSRWGELGAVRREESEPGVFCLDHRPDRGALVAGEVVHDQMTSIATSKMVECILTFSTIPRWTPPERPLRLGDDGPPVSGASPDRMICGMGLSSRSARGLSHHGVLGRRCRWRSSATSISSRTSRRGGGEADFQTEEQRFTRQDAFLREACREDW